MKNYRTGIVGVKGVGRSTLDHGDRTVKQSSKTTSGYAHRNVLTVPLKKWNGSKFILKLHTEGKKERVVW
jgi:hypothetical protein